MTWPTFNGARNCIPSTPAVTTRKLECLRAQTAAAISIQYMIRPPKTVPMVLASSGLAMIDSSVTESCNFLGCMT